MKLLEGLKDHYYVVEKIEGDLLLRNRLRRMSIQENSVIKIISNTTFFPYLVEVNHNRIAFSRKLAAKIEVTPYV